MSISASIVLYNNRADVVTKSIKSLIDNYPVGIKIYLIDNSPVNSLSKLRELGKKIRYIHNPSNPGFGAAHNIAINLAIQQGATYHFVVNPDTYFDGDIITPMVGYMEQNPQVGMMMPQILNPDRSIQYLPKLLPSPLTIIWRKVRFPKNLYNKFINNYELRFIAGNVIHEAPVISGCFTLLRLKAIEEIGGYDDRFFMYFEDWDLSRRIHEKYQTLYFPLVTVYHEYYSGANKSFKLFKIFLKSACHYFNKWGWLVDSSRKEINKAALAQFK